MDAVTLGLGALAAYFLIGKLNASSVGAGTNASYGIGAAQQPDYTPKDVSAEPTYSPEQKNVLMDQAVALYKSATTAGNINAVEAYRAQGMAAVASGTPIGVPADTANFIASSGAGLTPAESNPSNYVQTGGAIRYVGPTDDYGHPI